MGFNSWTDFNIFEKSIRYKNRFIHCDEVNAFLLNIKQTLPDRERRLPAGCILFRAQIGYDEDEIKGGKIICGYSRKRMKPDPQNCSEGRANPKGIPYLYLSNDESTSLAELRPNTGQYLSSAQFRVNRELKIVDCYSVPRHYDYIECLFSPPESQEEITNAVWSIINNAFTKPVTNSNSATDYVPTQMLAELFNSEGFDGICYKSGIAKGLNFILFNLDDADLINCTVMETMSVSYTFEECANRYFIEEDGAKVTAIVDSVSKL